MEVLSHLALGFSVALSPMNLLYCLLGVSLGTAIGVLPGVGPVVTIAVLLPLTFGLEPEAALIMLAGIYYGSQYGGSTTAILVNLPGEASSVVTCMDGYQMARQGRAGPALAIAAIGSFAAGTVATLVIALVGPPLAKIALEFRSPEYFSLMVFALVASASLVHGSMIKGILMALTGMLFGIIGIDINSGVDRFTFGVPELIEGVSFAIVALGLFAFPEIILNLERGDTRTSVMKNIGRLLPTLADLKASWRAVARGTAIGCFFGTLPGAGASVSSFAAYAVEKRVSRSPERFGKGAIEGVAAPESANNAAAQTSFIPTLTLGVPGSATMALMLGALMIQNVTPGPQIMVQRPGLFWGLIVSMWIGNLLLVILNLPLIGIWVSMLRTPYRWLYPAILMFCCLGAFTVHNSTLDVMLTAMFGLIGYLLVKLEFELAPVALGFILGPMVEENLRRSLLLSRGDPTVFLTEPISGGFLLATLLLIVGMMVPSIRRQRDLAVVEGD